MNLAKNREMFGKMLSLSSAQIAALNANDMQEFDRIIEEKREVIAALADARAMINADPSLEKVTAMINASEQAAQKILAEKMRNIRNEINGLRQRSKVRAAYASNGSLNPRVRMMTETGAARFLDRKH